MSDRAAFLSTVPGFKQLAQGDLERASEGSSEQTFAAGDYLMRRGDPGETTYIVRSGRLKVPVFDDGGRLRMMAHVGPGEVVGEMALLTGAPRNADVIAEEETTTVVFERHVFLPMLAEHPPLARFLTEILGQRLEEAGGIREVGKYRLLDKIGEGATAKVFEAIHPGLGRTVAVKMLSHELVYDPRFRDQFLDEARTMAALGHPNIVQVYDTEQAYGTCFVVMERLQGQNLLEYLTEHAPIGVGDAMAIIEQVGEALGFAHRHGIVHRDVKPANIAIDKDGTVKLMDFGIAAATSSLRGGSDTAEGTPRYIAPEAASGQSIDGRADLYSLGVVAFEMLTGRPLFQAESLEDLLRAHVQDAPPDVGKLRADLPDGLKAFITQSLAKRPEDRPRSWEELRIVLEKSGGNTKKRIEERILRLKYRPADRARVDRALASLRGAMSGLPEHDVAEAFLGGPAVALNAVEARPSIVGWFQRFSKGPEEPSETRPMPSVQPDE